MLSFGSRSGFMDHRLMPKITAFKQFLGFRNLLSSIPCRLRLRLVGQMEVFNFHQHTKILGVTFVELVIGLAYCKGFFQSVRFRSAASLNIAFIMCAPLRATAEYSSSLLLKYRYSVPFASCAFWRFPLWLFRHSFLRKKTAWAASSISLRRCCFSFSFLSRVAILTTSHYLTISQLMTNGQLKYKPA